ncbi:MAG: sulfurtransferase TusA family protein [Dehalococcoidales bacterium]|nr:sulfurtransferase TusA family protein [Dehalococcoidales bacterium]
MNADEQLDCLGMRCPRPIVEMAKKMRKMEAGQVLELLANDPVSKKDVPGWCHDTGNEFLGEEDGEGSFRFYVRKK